MTLVELDGLLISVGRRLRMERAANATWKLVAALLAALGLAVLGFKLLPARNPGLAVELSVLAVGLAMMGAFLTAYLRRPVSALRAAAEVDRLADLKERASSLVAARTGAAPRSAAFAELERDTAEALAPVASGEILRGLADLHLERIRWLAVLLAFVVGTLLVPGRNRSAGPELAALLVGGAELAAAVESAGAADSGQPSRPEERAARELLVILRGEPPADAEAAAKQKQSIEALAAELRKDGTPAGAELAARAEELARALGEIAARRPGDAPPTVGPQSDDERTRAAAARSYPEYSELLARYFGESGK